MLEVALARLIKVSKTLSAKQDLHENFIIPL